MKLTTPPPLNGILWWKVALFVLWKKIEYGWIWRYICMMWNTSLSPRPKKISTVLPGSNFFLLTRAGGNFISLSFVLQSHLSVVFHRWVLFALMYKGGSKIYWNPGQALRHRGGDFFLNHGALTYFHSENQGHKLFCKQKITGQEVIFNRKITGQQLFNSIYYGYFFT